jgi:hypothetical protein
MNESMALSFMKALNVGQVEQRGPHWLNGCCPMAPDTHASGSDSDPSFGIYMSPKEESHCFCFSCGYNGNLSKLLFDLKPIVKGDPRVDLTAAYKLVGLEAEGLEGYQPADEWQDGPITSDDFEAFPDWWLSGFKPWSQVQEGEEYVHERGVPPHLADLFDLRFDTKMNALCFPYWDSKNRLAGMRGRFLKPTGKNKYHDYKWNGINNSAKVWYNEQRINWMLPVVVAEGAFDVLAINRHYTNVMSPWTCTAKLDMLKDLKKATKVVCAFDNDKAGQMGYDRLQKLLGGEVALSWAKPPEGRDFADLFTSDVYDLLRQEGLPV